jgi:hypothetical protein
MRLSSSSYRACSQVIHNVTDYKTLTMLMDADNPSRMVYRGGTEANCREWIERRRVRHAAKVDRGAYAIVGPLPANRLPVAGCTAPNR